MAKQTFTTGQVLTAAQMTSLQQTAMQGGAASAKTASYTLVAADAGAAISMSNASATTITVNTALFAAGDTVHITNLGAGVCTITAGTATVNTSASLALAQYESGFLDFTTTSAAIFVKGAGGAAGGGGKILQVVNATTTTATVIASTSMTDTTITATITPTLATSKILVLITGQYEAYRGTSENDINARIMRGATAIASWTGGYFGGIHAGTVSNTFLYMTGTWTWLDSPATTSATTYKLQSSVASTANSGSVTWQLGTVPSGITLLEVGV